MMPLKILATVMFVGGAIAIYLSLSGKGGHFPIIPLILGITATCCGSLLAALIIRDPRKKSQA
ncbi:hypothetical protein [Streptomyces sp. NPDC088847]|uniref:hypothetical protein n=1 Tax=Streptomyces sp. NPDC088847 TaxID=3365909 RepID=UPI003824C834